MRHVTKLLQLLEKGSSPDYKSDHTEINFEGTDYGFAWKRFQDENIDKSKLFFELPTTVDDVGNVIEDSKETCGLEDQPHITLLYGLHNHEQLVAETASVSDYLKGTFGPIKKFSNKERGYDVLWISLKDHNLDPFVDALQEHTGIKSKFPKYTPHMTLAYVLPDSHDHLLGLEPLTGSFLADKIVYNANSNTGKSYSLSLNKTEEDQEDNSERLINVCSEALDVVPHGILGNTLFLSINGRKYGYEPAPESGKTLEEIEKTFLGMLKYGAGKALAWLKKVTVLASGSVKGLSKLDPNRYESIDTTRCLVSIVGDSHYLYVGGFKTKALTREELFRFIDYFNIEHPTRDIKDLVSAYTLPMRAEIPCNISISQWRRARSAGGSFKYAI